MIRHRNTLGTVLLQRLQSWAIQHHPLDHPPFEGPSVCEVPQAIRDQPHRIVLLMGLRGVTSVSVSCSTEIFQPLNWGPGPNGDDGPKTKKVGYTLFNGGFIRPPEFLVACHRPE